LGKDIFDMLDKRRTQLGCYKYSSAKLQSS